MGAIIQKLDHYDFGVQENRKCETKETEFRYEKLWTLGLKTRTFWCKIYGIYVPSWLVPDKTDPKKFLILQI